VTLGSIANSGVNETGNGRREGHGTASWREGTSISTNQVVRRAVSTHASSGPAPNPRSKGKVGVLGISHYAINQWHVALLQPPHLTAIRPWEGPVDWYREHDSSGGIVCTFWANWYCK
jgi:hypothetical protein